jgi:hypothetical protein
MYRRFHDRFGTAGVVIAVIALIAALGGTALAAGGLTGKQKKEVTKIAKKYAGKQGPQGLQGLPGANGKDGASGADGKSVVVSNTAPGCAEGGITVEIEGSGEEDEVCNGEPGQDATFDGSPLAPGVTLTGTWGGINIGGSGGLAPISFPIPLAADIEGANTHVIATPAAVVPAECDDGVAPAASFSHPEADPGQFCIFVRVVGGVTVAVVNKPTGSIGAAPGASVNGALVILEGASNGLTYGTWAVTAPTS